MPRPPSPRRLIVLLCAILLAGPAEAQGVFSDFWGSIFGDRPTVVQRPRLPRPRVRPAVARAPRFEPRATREARPVHESRPSRETRLQPPGHAAPAVPGQAPGAETPAAEPPPSFFVAVIGDSEASRLASGLDEAFGDDSRVAIVDKAKDDSGLVRDDFFDWRQEVKNLLEGPQHYDLVVIQIGVNDNQRMRVDADHQFDPLSKPFNEAYAKRVDEIANAFREKNIPLVWVGLPIMRSPSLSNAALALNDIDRQYATAAGARFVDLWEAFSDVNSAYKANGPDVNGVIVRLRGPDGIHFNDAGARKAAHFVEPEIKRVLEAKLQPPETPAPASTAPENPTASAVPGSSPEPEAPKAPAPPPEKPLAGKVTPLSDPVVSPGGALVSLPGVAAAARPAASPAQPGRADDFSWPGASPPNSPSPMSPKTESAPAK
jgi:hypothetical protein